MKRSEWDSAHNAQQGQMGTVDGNRSEPGDARHALEVVLVEAIHAVDKAFPTYVGKCKTYFNFSLLDAAKHPCLDRE